MVSASSSAPSKPPDICALLSSDCISLDLEVNSKKRALELLSRLISDHQSEPCEKQVFDSLLGRERLGSTGLGHGVAIPHGRLSEGSQPMAAFIRLAEGIDYDAPDGGKVDLIFSLLVPAEATSEHLQTLARLAEIFSDPAHRKALREANDAESIRRVLCA